jgi:predicted ATPase/DNA-binding SARP family transcriptional activator
MEFSILGPIEVRANGRAAALGGVKPRGLLAMLLLHANEAVSAERLALALWGEEAPVGAVKTVQVHVSRLRRALEDPDLLMTTPAGYRLRVRPGELDVERFEQRVADGRGALADGEPEGASALLREALELWRGPALAEVSALPFAPAEIARLEEQHLEALELLVEADLAIGRHAELIGELHQLTGEHPWRERLHAQLMLALYRSGRQADALEAYRHAREVLVEQLGIEPGAELHDLHEAILAHDPALDTPPATGGGPSDERDHTLPAPPNLTIGREQDLAAVGERLRTGSVRLLTLTGPGGVGKTRLALETARTVETDFTDGARFVSLGAVQRSEDVPAAIVKALEVVLLGGESDAQAVERFLAAKHLLLVADNVEHVLGAAPFIGGLLGACPALTVLATSREPLALHAEERYPVSPLTLPEGRTPADPEALAGVDAIALFTERARAHDPDFELADGNAADVTEICRRVDGLPLAIELAAARCALLSSGEIAERLSEALGSLGAGARDAPARQQTLRATIDWSHELLSDADRESFARFAVFAGGATIEAAETITGAGLEAIDALVAKSLLVRVQRPHTATRLAMLETIRAYASERFAAGAGAEAVRERHYRVYLAVAQRHGTDQALLGVRGKENLARLDAEVDNLQAALRWALDRRNSEHALTMVAALGSYWLTRDRHADAVNWIDQALSLPGTDAHPALRVRALCDKGWGLWRLGRGDEESAVLDEAEAFARRLDDPLAISAALKVRADREARGDHLAVASALADEALHYATAAGNEWAIASALSAQAKAAGTIAAIRERVDRAAPRLAEVGNVAELAALLSSASYEALCIGSDQDALQFVDRALPVARDLASPLQWMFVRGNFGLAALLTGDADSAQLAFCDELELCRELVTRPLAGEGLLGLAAVAASRGAADRAARLVGAATAHSYGMQQPEIEARLEAAFLEPARRRHGAGAWAAAVREGTTLNFEDAIAYALEGTPA